MNSTQTITIEVDAQVAEAYNAASPEDHRKLNALLSLKLSDALVSPRSLETVMADLSKKAQMRGLTPDILREILEDES